MADDVTEQDVIYEQREQLALITINRAEKHNAISLATLSQLQASVSRASRSPVREAGLLHRVLT